MLPGAGAGSRKKKIPGAGVAPKHDGFETLFVTKKLEIRRVLGKNVFFTVYVRLRMDFREIILLIKKQPPDTRIHKKAFRYNTFHRVVKALAESYFQMF